MPLLSTFGGASIRGFMSGKTYKTYTLIADTTVGTATTSVTFSGLNYNAGDELVLNLENYNSSGIGSDIFLYVNGNTTSTNYWTQHLLAYGTGVASARYNNPSVGYCYNNTRDFFNVRIKLTNNNYFVFQSSGIRYSGSSSIDSNDLYGTSTFTATSITSLTVTGQFSPATRFQLYKINP